MFIIDFLKKFEVHSTLIIAFLVFVHHIATPADKMQSIIGVDFEVYGKVQGVFFRKHTQSKAKELGLTGWCMNTKQGTVIGYAEGPQSKIEKMKRWLETTGSPQSSIEKAIFKNERELVTASLKEFSISKDVN